MPPAGAGPLYCLALLLALPFQLLRDLWRIVSWIMSRRAHWQSVPLQYRSRFRAAAGTFVLVILIGATADGLIPFDNPLALWATIGGAGFSLLYIGGGLLGLKCKTDPLSIFWWSCLAAGCAALLVVVGGGFVRW